MEARDSGAAGRPRRDHGRSRGDGAAADYSAGVQGRPTGRQTGGAAHLCVGRDERRRPMRRRRGTAYVMVVAIAGMAGVTALSAIFILAAQRRLIELQADAGAARAIAISGVERACAMIDADANWRWNQESGVWVLSEPLGDGVYTVEVTDPVDGDFTDNEGDPVRI